MHQCEREHECAHENDVPVIGRVALGDVGPPHRERAREVAGCFSTCEPTAPVREVDHRQDDGRRPREHERDERQVETREPQCGKPYQHPYCARDRPDEQYQHRKRELRRVGESGPRPAADREQGDLAERDHPDPAVQEPEARCDHGVDGDARQRGDPVRTEEARQPEQREQQEAENDQTAHDRAPVDRSRPASEGSPVALGCLLHTHRARSSSSVASSRSGDATSRAAR